MYNQICSIENLELAYKKARRGKTLKPYVIEYEKDLKSNLEKLRTELMLHSYRPAPLTTFVIMDTKTRVISRSEFRDRVVHHAIVNILEPIYEKQFIYDSYANRRGKGTLKAIKRFDRFKRKVSRNNTRSCYILKADIRHYFETVDHATLLRILKQQVSDKRVIWLIKTILSNHTRAKGMPLGNLTSQFFANVYLDQLDQYVKHSLKAKYYIRYVDDFVILHRDKQLLEEARTLIEDFLRCRLQLEIHPSKSRVILLSRGVVFLGFRNFYHYRLLKPANIMKFVNKLKWLDEGYKAGCTTYDKIYDCTEGWLAYAKNADAHKISQRIISTIAGNYQSAISGKEIDRYIRIMNR